ncbi:RNA-directed DNA polymerase [Salinimicrobium sp. CAU 1759]
MGLGLDASIINQLNRELSVKRINRDVQNDFIFSPHFSLIYSQASDELADQLLSKLKAGKYNPRLPVTINVIKSNGFNRNGSILEPFDRLAYQLITDFIAPQAEHEIDRSQVFSNKLLLNDEEGAMFERSHDSYKAFQNHVEENCKNSEYSYVLKADIASFFDRLYQHVLGNLLYSSGANSKAVSFLERQLLQFSQNDSHGIIQGVSPSDFLGNFYLCSIDGQHSLEDLKFSRYVDDMYIFFPDLNSARVHKIRLSNWLKKDGLTLNEYKTKILPVENLLQEETEIDRLFRDAQFEIMDEFSGIGYETVTSWNLEANGSIEDEDMELMATQALFDNHEVERNTRLKVERFCLPIFSAGNNDHALEYVLNNYSAEPSMSQTYFGYLRKLVLQDSTLVNHIEPIFSHNNMIFDYQKKWLYSVLLYAENVSDSILKQALSDLQNPTKNPALRAICAILVGKNGTAQKRRILKNHYSNEQSEYVKSAILFASQYFPKQEKDTCFRAWSGHNETNALIVTAIKKQ